MRIQVTIPGEPNAETLGIALEAATRLAQHDIASGTIPPIEDAIKGGIRWQEEPPGQESFDNPSTVLDRGWADCDDLAPWLVAEMRETDYDPGASAIAIPSGHNTWHAVVRGSGGEMYDPSVWAGMPHTVGGPAHGGRCACCKPLNPGKPALAIGARGVRVDVPGLRATRGCVIGVSHQSDCEPDDESRVIALVRTIEAAIATAQLARTGDKRAIKQLAIIYRVLRGDDIHAACNGVGLRPEQVGLDFDSSAVRQWIRKAREVLANACDEAFAGDTWMASGDRIVPARKVALSGRAHRMGFVPCLAPIAPIAAAAATAGTWAAVVESLALALQNMAGKNTDFGRAMGALMQVTDKVKLVSAVGAGIGGLIEGGIPQAFQAGSSRWVELLQSPLAAAGQGGNAAQVANTLHWVEKNAATVLPPDLSTWLAPQVLDLVAQSQKYVKLVDDPNTPFASMKDLSKKASDEMKKAYELVKDQTKKWLESVKDVPGALPPGFDAGKIEKLAEAKAGHFFDVLVSAPPPPVVEIHALALASELPAVAVDEGPTPGQVDAVEFVAANLGANLDRKVLHPPIDVDAPEGWDDIFARGCLQQTDMCS